MISQLTIHWQIDWNAFDQQFKTHFTNDGRPVIATRLMVALHYLKCIRDLSNEEALARWVENPYWQHFSGRQHLEHRLPQDPSSMTRWRKRIGVEGAETLLSQTIATAVEQRYLKISQCQKSVLIRRCRLKRFDSRRMHERLVKTAQDESIN